MYFTLCVPVYYICTQKKSWGKKEDWVIFISLITSGIKLPNLVELKLNGTMIFLQNIQVSELLNIFLTKNHYEQTKYGLQVIKRNNLFEFEINRCD